MNSAVCVLPLILALKKVDLSSLSSITIQDIVDFLTPNSNFGCIVGIIVLGFMIYKTAYFLFHNLREK